MKDFDGVEFDQDYIRKLRAGDESTEAHFVAHFGALLHIRLHRRLASIEHIDIVRKAVFSRVLAALHSERGLDYAGHLSTFVSRVCSEVLHEFPGSLAHSSSRLGPSAGKSAESSKSDVWVRNLARQVLRGFSEKERQFLRAVLFENLNADAVSKDLGLSRHYLPVLLFRAKRKFLVLYKLLKDRD